MQEWFLSSVEYTHWGYNMPTIGFVGMLVFTFAEGWVTIKQSSAIRKNDSGKSVSVIFFFVLFFYLVAFGVYGFFQKSISEMFNGFVLAALHIPLLHALWKSKGITQREQKIIYATSVIIPLMIIIPWKDAFYMIIASIVTASSVDQVRELYVSKNAGVVEICLLWTYFCSVSFWTIYASTTEQFVLSCICFVNLFIITIAIFLWYKYRKNSFPSA